MNEKLALEIANKYYPDFVWVYAERMHNDGWLVRPEGDGHTKGLPGVYIDPDGSPEMYGSVPDSWPQAIHEFIQLSDEKGDEDWGDFVD